MTEPKMFIEGDSMWSVTISCELHQSTTSLPCSLDRPPDHLPSDSFTSMRVCNSDPLDLGTSHPAKCEIRDERELEGCHNLGAMPANNKRLIGVLGGLPKSPLVRGYFRRFSLLAQNIASQKPDDSGKITWLGRRKYDHASDYAKGPRPQPAFLSCQGARCGP